MAIFRYGDLADNIVVSENLGDNTWYLNRGEDSLRLSYGNNIVYGGWGNDIISEGDGQGVVFGGDGHDSLYGSRGFDTLYGERGNDYLGDDWDGEADNLYGGPGNDLIFSDGGLINAGVGNDLVELADPNTPTYVWLGTGHDRVVFKVDIFDAPTGHVDIYGFKADDKLTMGAQLDEYLVNGQLLDVLDTNDDGWLGSKDAKPFDDINDFGVTVGQNSLTLTIFDVDLVLHGMKNASFDFLS